MENLNEEENETQFIMHLLFSKSSRMDQSFNILHLRLRL